MSVIETLAQEDRDLVPESQLAPLQQMEWEIFWEHHGLTTWKQQLTAQKLPGYWALAEIHRQDYAWRAKKRNAILEQQRKAEEKAQAAEPVYKSIVPKRAQAAKAKAAADAAKIATNAPKRKPGRPKGSTVAPKVKQTGGPNLCRKCNKVIPPTGRKGRPSAYHEKCRPVK